MRYSKKNSFIIIIIMITIWIAIIQCLKAVSVQVLVSLKVKKDVLKFVFSDASEPLCSFALRNDSSDDQTFTLHSLQ